MLIHEVILENFMSYEYARVPLKSGVNIICGPNGAGKSSVLLGISVALGQSYTERSRKLSNLIRWGKDQARVTIVLDNSKRKGKRPVRKFDKDQIFLTRILRRDGKYWCELDNRAATKREVERLLAKFNVDPDNLLILMHQNMTEQFTVLSSQEKLRTVEAAVGLESYRKNVLQARKKLSRISSEEQSVNKLLETAEQTLNYWRGQYDRYQEKKQLQMKKRFIEREYVWAEASKKETAMNEIEGHLKKEEDELQEIKSQTAKHQMESNELQSKLAQSRAKWQKLFQERLLIEREKAKNEALVSLSTKTLEETNQFFENIRKKLSECIDMIEQLEISMSTQHNPKNYVERLIQIKGTYKDLENVWTQQFNQRNENLMTLMENFNEHLEKTDNHLLEIQQNTEYVTKEIEDVTSQVIDVKINNALLAYKKQEIEKDLLRLRRELRVRTEEFGKAKERAQQTGSQVASTRKLSEILDEIRLTDGYLTALGDVSEEIEHMYESYSKLYLDLKEKARAVAENREKTLEEVNNRTEAWRKVMHDILDHVSLQYQKIVSQAQAVGEVHLTDANDLEVAGIEVLVGFKGAQPVPLDAYTQSGGERSMATMSFLLALQQHVQSPLRAVDEYDIHMDPKNREMITKLLIESVTGLNSQYVIITPSQITFAKENTHIITVQNIEGMSRVKEVTRKADS
ncbi:MAG: AAA family ATPase [Candidatus Bathyarchaeota archaeon]|nr:MAG: AAA family ATPase [Candidatus Bathyarchaeota archaeon]